jgi:uncharacterized membrane protein
MPLWLIPMAYAVGSIAAAIALPRLEHAYLPAYDDVMSVNAALATLSAAASGMMALTGIVFSIVFVMVQFSAIAYSPRLVLWFGRDPTLFHSLGVFVATFVYALAALAWTDRAGSGTVPLYSCLLVGLLLILSILLFSRLVRRVSDLQITSVLALIGDRGREVIAATLLPRERVDGTGAGGLPTGEDSAGFASVTQTLIYAGRPLAIAEFDIAALVSLAQRVGGVIVLACAVGDTVVDGTPLLRIHGAKDKLPAKTLLRAIRLARERTFEQDPKYPIRLLVDIAIKALSPAINDPTTAVQALDQIEDLLRRLARRELDVRAARDRDQVLRVVIPMPTWEDYLALACDEIRQYGATSIQVMRRLRSALVDLVDAVQDPARADAVRRYLTHLDRMIERSPLDAEDRLMARREDRQGLGLTRGPATP